MLTTLVPFNASRLLDDKFFSFPSIFDSSIRDAYHFKDGDKELTLFLEVPGSEKKDIKTEYENGVLTISIESKTDVREIKKNYSWDLSDKFDGDNIKGELKNGVLKLILPKRNETKKRLIEIS